MTEPLGAMSYYSVAAVGREAETIRLQKEAVTEDREEKKTNYSLCFKIMKYKITCLCILQGQVIL